MREIKYRAWSTSSNKMVEWIVLKRNAELLKSALCGEVYMTNPPRPLFITEQFTGLHDKNGVDIYEGDIVLCNPDKIVAWWDKAKMTFPESFATVGDFELVEHTDDFKLMPFHCESNIDDGCYNESRYFQVIGNIHENKEFKTLGYIYGFEPQVITSPQAP